MRQTTGLILRIACVASIAFCGLLALQLTKIVPPIGVGWGDSTRGRAFSFGIDGAIVFATLAGMKPMPPGSAIGTDGAPIEVFGIRYHRWSLIALANDRTPLPGTYGTRIELRIGLGWTVLLALALVVLCIAQRAKQRRLASANQLCPNCGYDLRATPHRCPECGLERGNPAAT